VPYSADTGHSPGDAEELPGALPMFAGRHPSSDASAPDAAKATRNPAALDDIAWPRGWSLDALLRRRASAANMLAVTVVGSARLNTLALAELGCAVSASAG
jgi:hypothetical protein